MRYSTSWLLPLSLQAMQVASIVVVDFKSCPIPYMVPRVFETQCDPIQRKITDEMNPTFVDAGSPYKTHPSQFVANKYMRTTPDIWQYEPWCMFSEQISTVLCAFTSTAFARGRGISLVMQADEAYLAERATALRNLRDYEWPAHVNPENDTRIEVMPIPGKGLGIRAKTIFRRGETAQSYTPVLAVQDAVMQLELNSVEQNLAIMVGVHRLPEKARNKFVQLWGHFGGNPYYDKINTNAFNAVIGGSEVFFWSVYPETSRYNHDCRPNTMYSIENMDLLHNLRVARMIIPGEEVSLSYLAPNMRTAERKVRMQSQWGFDCGCSLCQAADHVQRASDERLVIMDEIEGELNDLSWNRTANVQTAELLISLHEQERLDGVIGDAYMYAAFENAYLGNKRLVQKYAALAIEHMAIWRGIQHQYYMAMMRLLYNPEKEKSWLYFEKLKAAEEAANGQ